MKRIQPVRRFDSGNGAREHCFVAGVRGGQRCSSKHVDFTPPTLAKVSSIAVLLVMSRVSVGSPIAPPVFHRLAR